MDINAYINSGELELYVLDRLSPDERRRVEDYAVRYPEVREELNAIELDLEAYALLRGQQTPPPDSVLTSVLAVLPAKKAAVSPPPSTPPPAKSNDVLPWVLGGLLLLALAGLLYFFLQTRERADQVGELQERFSILEEDCERVLDNARENERQLALLSDLNTTSVVLEGSDNAPDSRAVVFYNSVDGEVLFSAVNLPPPPDDRQYQLWAIDEEGPQDLGVLSRTLEEGTLSERRFVPNTQAFAITLEEDGGRPTPDLSQLQVIGNVGS